MIYTAIFFTCAMLGGQDTVTAASESRGGITAEFRNVLDMPFDHDKRISTCEIEVHIATPEEANINGKSVFVEDIASEIQAISDCEKSTVLISISDDVSMSVLHEMHEVLMEVRSIRNIVFKSDGE